MVDVSIFNGYDSTPPLATPASAPVPEVLTTVHVTSSDKRAAIDRYGIDWYQRLVYNGIRADEGTDLWLSIGRYEKMIKEIRRQNQEVGQEFEIVGANEVACLTRYVSEEEQQRRRLLGSEPSSPMRISLRVMAKPPSDAWDITEDELRAGTEQAEVRFADARLNLHWALNYMGSGGDAYLRINEQGRGWIQPSRLPAAFIQMAGWPPMTLRRDHVSLLCRLLEQSDVPINQAGKPWPAGRAAKVRTLVIIRLSDDDGQGARWFFGRKHTKSWVVLRLADPSVDVDPVTQEREIIGRFRIDSESFIRMVAFASMCKAGEAEFALTATDAAMDLYVREKRPDSNSCYREIVSLESAEAETNVWWTCNLAMARKALKLVVSNAASIDVAIDWNRQELVLSTPNTLAQSGHADGGEVAACASELDRQVSLPIALLECSDPLPYSWFEAHSFEVETAS